MEKKISNIEIKRQIIESIEYDDLKIMIQDKFSELQEIKKDQVMLHKKIDKYPELDEAHKYFYECYINYILLEQTPKRAGIEYKNLVTAYKLKKRREMIKNQSDSTNGNNIQVTTDKFIDADEVISNVSISEVVGAYTDIKHPKRNLKCPFHKDNHPSFKIYEDTNSYYCFSCGKGGNAINFLMNIENCDFYSALKILHTFY